MERKLEDTSSQISTVTQFLTESSNGCSTEVDMMFHDYSYPFELHVNFLSSRVLADFAAQLTNQTISLEMMILDSTLQIQQINFLKVN
jgi:hypothetical protein